MPCMHSQTLRIPLQIRVVNTWKEIWGEGAVAPSSTYFLPPLIVASHLAKNKTKPPLFSARFNPERWSNLPTDILDAVLHRWTSCMYQEDYGYYWDESCFGVRRFPVLRWLKSLNPWMMLPKILSLTLVPWSSTLSLDPPFRIKEPNLLMGLPIECHYAFVK